MSAAHGRPQPVQDARLTEGNPGTPGGEPLRRHRQPVGPAEPGDLAGPGRVLGGDRGPFRGTGGW